MTRVAWAMLITAAVLFGLVRAVQSFGAPLVIIVVIIVLSLGLKARNRYVGHRASGLDAENQPGRAITVDDRTSRWWDAEAEIEHGHRAWLAKLIPFMEIRVGSLDKARKQQRDQHAGRPVRPIDWTSPNRNGGSSFAGGMTASGMTYDWCTCSEQAMPLIDMPDGSQKVNRGEETCLCLCSSCAPKGRYRDADGKWQPIVAQHWRARDMEHEVAVNLAAGHAYERQLSVRIGRRWDAVVGFVEQRRQDRRDEQLARDIGYVDIDVRRRRGETVNTDTDEWHWQHGVPEDGTAPDPNDWRTGRHADTDHDPTDPLHPRPGGHE